MYIQINESSTTVELSAKDAKILCGWPFQAPIALEFDKSKFVLWVAIDCRKLDNWDAQRLYVDSIVNLF